MSSTLDPRLWLSAPAGVRRLGSAVVDLVDRFDVLGAQIEKQTAETIELRNVAESLRSETRLIRGEIESLRDDLREVREKIPGL